MYDLVECLFVFFFVEELNSVSGVFFSEQPGRTFCNGRAPKISDCHGVQKCRSTNYKATTKKCEKIGQEV